jgi:hypothetical protein
MSIKSARMPNTDMNRVACTIFFPDNGIAIVRMDAVKKILKKLGAKGVTRAGIDQKRANQR